jgi:Asp-tRNA(Asn)/Glu-tRNA(Gln) amidotransferase A subunit family amidase
MKSLLIGGGAAMVLATALLATAPPQDNFEVVERTIPELQAALQAGRVTSAGLVDRYLARIAAYDRKGPRLNAIIAVNPKARDEAAALDRERVSRGARGLLHGIPLVVKDNFDLAGMPTTAGSIAFAALYPPDDAFQVKKLKAAGAVILAKTNLQELASGIVTVGSMGGQTRNPYDLLRNPGGSSGGTGAAVAANFAAAGLGSDTCGSIRIPASHNALVGMRSTAGLASRDGVVPLSHTQDIAGPLARTVTDVAILLDATVGVDPADPITKLGEGRAPAGNTSYRDALKKDALKGARIGVLRSLFGAAPEDNEAGAVVRRAIDEMKKQGAEVQDVAVPGLDDLLAGSSVINAEFKFDLADYLAQVPGAPVKSLGEILDGGLIHVDVEPSARRRNAAEARETDAYRRARVKRESVRQAVLAAFEEHRLDAMAYPVMKRKPALIGESQAGSNCQLSAASGLPALAVPAGYTTDGLPIGVELLGRAFDEAGLLAIAYAYEQAASPRRPPFSAPALVNGLAPAGAAFSVRVPVANEAAGAALVTRFTFDATTGELRYEAALTGVPAERMFGAWIQRGGTGDKGPAVYPVLMRSEVQASGTVTVPAPEHARLLDGRFYLAVYTRGSPDGASRAQVAVR